MPQTTFLLVDKYDVHILLRAYGEQLSRPSHSSHVNDIVHKICGALNCLEKLEAAEKVDLESTLSDEIPF